MNLIQTLNESVEELDALKKSFDILHDMRDKAEKILKKDKNNAEAKTDLEYAEKRLTELRKHCVKIHYDQIEQNIKAEKRRRAAGTRKS